MGNDAVMICATAPNRRYEIEIFSGGSMEVEIFGADGRIGGQDLDSRPSECASAGRSAPAR